MSFPAKFPGRCAVCGEAIAVGERIDWNRATRVTRHAACVPGAAKREQAREQTITASRATTADVAIPAPDGLEYLPFQCAGIGFALDRSATLIADEMGLGKTIQTVGIINADASIKRVLVICPASLKLNWRRELTKWLVRPLTIGIASTQEWPEAADIVICNWDIASK